jgi:rhomboid protease GluP
VTAGPVTPPPPPRPRGAPLSTQIQRAPVTFAIIAFTGAVFLLQVASSYLGRAPLLLPCGLRTYDLLQAWGAKDSTLLAQGQIWRLVTPVFIHAGLLHVGVNMYSLFALGPAVERFFGAPRYLAVYLYSGISGVILSTIATPACSVGASGAIFGLLGALAMFLYLHRGVFGRGAGIMLRQLIIVGGLNLLLSLSPGIDLWGHVGGLLAGAACTAFFGPRLRPVLVGGVASGLHDERPWPEVAPRVIAAAIAVGAAALAAIFLAGRA